MGISQSLFSSFYLSDHVVSWYARLDCVRDDTPSITEGCASFFIDGYVFGRCACVCV
jgi:hypothetical protein